MPYSVSNKNATAEQNLPFQLDEDFLIVTVEK